MLWIKVGMCGKTSDANKRMFETLSVIWQMQKIEEVNGSNTYKLPLPPLEKQKGQIEKIKKMWEKN